MWSEYGIGTYNKTESAYLTWQRIGGQYAPVDGYVPNNGMAGYSFSVFKTWYRDSKAMVPRILAYDYNDEFKKPDGTIGQADHQFAVGEDVQHLFGMKPLIHIRWQTGSSWVQLGDGNVVSTSQNGVDVIYNYRTATEDRLSFYTGRFGPGTLDYWTRTFNVRLRNDVTLSIEGDDSDQRLDDGTRNKQWLERGSIVWQPSKTESLSVGARRIIGPSPILEFATPPSYYNDWNLSAGVYRRFPHDEFYLVYGDPSQLTTYPALFFKYIHYFGAEKGV
ncbi:MAG TPA: hypothetical protein VFN49_12215 [Candidatus Aquilonibacter sp.]|nr:hypothetical protein [Candidatus Aquilonibacter sp.]